MVTDTNREYELVVIVSHEADEDETATALEMITNFISGHGGSVSAREDWGIKRLAYPIKNYREGNYVLFKFILSSDEINELDRIIRSSQNIIRHLVTVATGSNTEESEQDQAADQEETADQEPVAEQDQAADQEETADQEPVAEQDQAADQEETADQEPAAEQVTQSDAEDDSKD